MQREALTLYELNSLVREVIENVFDRSFWVEAELSEAREVQGHCYMELIQKNDRYATPIAKASAKCWRNVWGRLKVKFEQTTGQSLRAGMQVMLKVTANFHEAYGFSWIVQDIDPTYTLGDMARKRMEIIRQLQEEGVIDMQKSLTLPMFAQHIAVISSEGAAGYGDFCHQLLDNEAGLWFETELFPAVMQGDQVEPTVIAALDAINARLEAFDAVVIIRGGGATADMSGFDTLNLAENVANFPLPIITGIGHDRDESVLDMVSFKRVKTPTAAAISRRPPLTGGQPCCRLPKQNRQRGNPPHGLSQDKTATTVGTHPQPVLSRQRAPNQSHRPPDDHHQYVDGEETAERAVSLTSTDR